ncbi:MAG: dimethyl sulfoxide reductase anchor subunit [Firmicutes bacterium]|nr:dimethyl sulfoxide reductase anchor subunit [Bacillota bacterium]
MRPAPQLIVLTIGQGLAGGLAVAFAALWSIHPTSATVADTLVLMALAAAGIGGIASVFHMHHMQAARYILRRLKTSWLSREALTTAWFGGALAVLAVWTLFIPEKGTGYLVWLWLTVALGLLAMWVTAMLYATIPAVLSWHTPVTVLSLLSVGLLSGGAAAGIAAPFDAPPYQVFVVALMVLAVWTLLVKGLHWRHFHEAHGRLRAETGTGLPFAPYRLQDTGTTKPPYRTQTQVAPIIPDHMRHTATATVVVLMVLAPVLFLILTLTAHVRAWSIIAAIAVLVGAVAERWLFFADATHSSRVFFVDESRHPARVGTVQTAARRAVKRTQPPTVSQ